MACGARSGLTTGGSQWHESVGMHLPAVRKWDWKGAVPLDAFDIRGPDGMWQSSALMVWWHKVQMCIIIQNTTLTLCWHPLGHPTASCCAFDTNCGRTVLGSNGHADHGNHVLGSFGRFRVRWYRPLSVSSLFYSVMYWPLAYVWHFWNAMTAHGPCGITAEWKVQEIDKLATRRHHNVSHWKK